MQPVAALAVLALTLLPSLAPQAAAGAPERTAQAADPGPAPSLAFARVPSPSGSLPSARPSRPSAAQTAVIELVRQRPTVDKGDPWSAGVRVAGVPADSYLRVVVYRFIDSRETFEETLEGDGLGRPILSSAAFDPLAALPVDSEGVRTTTLRLTDRLTAGRTYPVELRIETPDQRTLTSLITYLVVLPSESSDVEPLSVAFVADLRAEPHLQSDGTVELRDAELEDLGAAAAALAGSGRGATLAITPELLDAVAAAGDDGTGVLEDLVEAARRSAVLARPYVEVSAQALADARLDDQLPALMEQGHATLRNVLRTEPHTGTWIATPGLQPSGLDLLQRSGVHRLVAPDGVLEDTDDDEPARTVAVPLISDSSRALETAAPDPLIDAVLDDQAEPALLAQRVVAALAVSWREEPGLDRGLVAMIDPRRHPDATRILLGTDAPGMLRLVDLSELYASVDVATDPSDEPITRELSNSRAEPIGRAVAAELRAVQRLLTGYRSMLEPGSPRATALARHLAAALAQGLSGSERRGHLAVASTEVETTLDAISLPSGGRVTLTARSGTIPLTIRRTSDVPVTVRLHLTSSRLEFPEGDSMVVPLAEELTRLDVDVRTLASGAFPLSIELTSPDGTLAVDDVRFTVQSTAVSGVGLVLSAGAGLFLAAWWGSHWRRARRSKRLVPRHATRH